MRVRRPAARNADKAAAGVLIKQTRKSEVAMLVGPFGHLANPGELGVTVGCLTTARIEQRAKSHRYGSQKVPNTDLPGFFALQAACP